jgi:Flp pilus assembly pilin Flp
MDTQILLRVVLRARCRLARVLDHCASTRGASLTEYALLVGLIAAACIASIEYLGDSAAAKLTTVGSSIGQP